MDKEWEKHENIPAWNLTKVRGKSEVIDEAKTKGGATVHFASWGLMADQVKGQGRVMQVACVGPARFVIWAEVCNGDAHYGNTEN